MADYLLTYDFKSGASNQWAEFVKCAELEGLIYVYDVGDELARLTNTTLWGLFENKQAAKAAFGRAQAAAEKHLGRAITLEKRVNEDGRCICPLGRQEEARSAMDEIDEVRDVSCAPEERSVLRLLRQDTLGRKPVKVTTTTNYVDLDGDYGTVEGVEVTCDRCGHSEESFGTGDGSLKRCAYLLRENCPRSETNYYEVDA